MDALKRVTPRDAGIALSLLLHLAVWAAFSWRWQAHLAEGAVDAMEIDLSRPFRITDNPALAHRAKNPGAGAAVVEKPTPIAGKGQAGGQETSAEGKGAVKDWTLPDPKAHQVLEKPAEAAPRRDRRTARGKARGWAAWAASATARWIGFS